MLKKWSSFLFVLVALGLFSVFAPAMAKPENNPDDNLPEQEGVYAVSGHPHMKLRVFIHRTKQPRVPAPVLSCNLPDLGSSAVVAGAGWKIATSTPWTYRLNLSSVPSSVSSANLPAISGNAYDAWRQAVNGKVSFVRGSDTSVNRAKRDGQNIITWGRASGGTLAVSYIWYNTATGLATEVDTIMNNKYFWNWSDPATWQTQAGTTCAYQNVYDAQDILTHELGHTVGLDDEYAADYQNNTMYGYGSTGETNADTLTQGDSVGAQNLYQ